MIITSVARFKLEIKETKQNFSIVVPQNVRSDSSKDDHVITFMLKNRVVLPLLRDLRGHGNTSDYFLWSPIWAGVKGHLQQLPTREPWSAADAQPDKQVNSV